MFSTMNQAPGAGTVQSLGIGSSPAILRLYPTTRTCKSRTVYNSVASPRGRRAPSLRLELKRRRRAVSTPSTISAIRDCPPASSASRPSL
jgi:hypothetical protein